MYTLPRTYSVDSFRRLSCPGARIRRRRSTAAPAPRPHFGAPPLAVVARHSPLVSQSSPGVGC
jgi:hypothetical protein